MKFWPPLQGLLFKVKLAKVLKVFSSYFTKANLSKRLSCANFSKVKLSSNVFLSSSNGNSRTYVDGPTNSTSWGSTCSSRRCRCKRTLQMQMLAICLLVTQMPALCLLFCHHASVCALLAPMLLNSDLIRLNSGILGCNPTTR
ncbi:hypothetical protein GGF31_001202 [Allomyces arbusculus]|nr:hypothetical protein GGF31_001202 [Allomyces arbusculus]